MSQTNSIVWWYFEQLRRDDNHHLGLGDVRLSVGQQEELATQDAEMREELVRLRDGCRQALSALNHAAEVNEKRPPPQGETYTGTRTMLRELLKNDGEV